MDSIPPNCETDDDFEMRPGEDFSDYLDRRSEFHRREMEKIKAESRAVCQATMEKLDEIVFYSNLASKVWDETAARIQAIRAQDEPKPPSPELPPGS